MKAKTLLTAIALQLAVVTAWSQDVSLPPLHVSGNQLVTPEGKAIQLHGVMDTPNPYFNYYRWGDKCNRNTAKKAINYFDQICTAMTDHEQGSYANFLRLCIDACWVNDPTISVSGDADDLSAYSATRLKNYMQWVFFPIIKNAINHGMYVSIRPPYGPPSKIKVGDDFQKNLTEVWGIMCRDDSIRKYSGWISLELANEPVTIVDKFGNSNNNQLTSYFQPVIDTIRATGFDGVIWVPGSGYQTVYTSYVNNPPKDDNFGYAVHVYPGWYSQSDDNADSTTFITNFEKQVPVVKTNPIFVSEVDWSPEKEGEGKYNEFGEWVPANYGTWGTGSTSKWGTAYKGMVDHFGNVSWTLQGTSLYIDVDAYLKDGTVKPAFDGNWECCAAPCFQWFKEYYEADENGTTGIVTYHKPQSTSPSPTGEGRGGAFNSQSIYDLQGRKVDGSSLRSGIYIQSGKKYFKK